MRSSDVSAENPDVDQASTLDDNAVDGSPHSSAETAFDTAHSAVEIEVLRAQLADVPTLAGRLAVASKCSALAHVTARRALSINARIALAELGIRARREVGKHLERAPKHPGGRPPRNRVQHKTSFVSGASVATLRELGISKGSAARSRRLAAIPEVVVERYFALCAAAGTVPSDAGGVRHPSGGKTSKLPDRARPWEAAYRSGLGGH